MAPTANTNSMPNREKAPAASHARQHSNSRKAQNRSATARIRAGSDACDRSHVTDHINAAQFDAGSDPTDQKSTTTPSMITTAEHDIQAEIEKHLRESGPRGADILLAFRDASILPPITPDSLAELDMPRIINNPKLRHDVNFDRELHFRPNLDGARGQQKIKSADDYWKALEAELYMLDLVQRALLQPGGAADPEYWLSLMRESRRRLPNIFEAVRDILVTLVPDQDQPKITERLDVDLLIQQIDNGVCDLVDLANWLGKVLKNHCAPMRDGLVDKMRKSITKGAQQADQKLMVSGLRQLLNLLEAMKLDVANHQIRHMRPLLIADTINFQKRYNDHRIGLGKLNPEVSRSWLEQECENFSTSEGDSPSYMDTLTHALLRDLLFCSSTTSLTSTFYLDLERLRSIRVDMHNMICQRVCGDIFVELVGFGAPRSEISKALSVLRTSLSAIVGPQGLWTERIENVAAEIVRIALSLEGRINPYDSNLLSHAERKLQDDLEPTSAAFGVHAQEMLDRLLPKTKECVNAHCRLTPIELQEALVPPMPSTPSHSLGMGAVCEPVAMARSTDPDMDLIRRFTHVVVLHWQVWADLVYLVEPEPEYGLSSPPPSASPEPVARAVFNPGNKFMPESVTIEPEQNGIPTPAPSPDPEDLTDKDAAESIEGPAPFFSADDPGL
ncbi:hypothetical protein Q7P37_008807 [Cladosporium fusiforme]